MATLGYTTIASVPNTLSGNYVLAFGPYMAVENGSIVSASVYLGSTSGQGLTIGVYLDNSGVPDVLVGVSSGGTASDGWNTQSISGSIVNGSSYWIAFDAAATLDAFYDGASENLIYAPFTYSSGSLLSPFGTPENTLTNRIYSAYLTYAQASAGNPWLLYAQQRRQ